MSDDIIVKRTEIKRTGESERCDCHGTRHRVLYEVSGVYDRENNLVLCALGFSKLKQLVKPTVTTWTE